MALEHEHGACIRGAGILPLAFHELVVLTEFAHFFMIKALPGAITK